MRIAMHVLKADLSRYVAMARAGAVIEITSHDKPIVRIVGFPPAGLQGVERLLACGVATWQGGKPTPVPAVKLGAAGRPLSDTALEDRG